MGNKALSGKNSGLIPKYFDFTIKNMINIDSTEQQNFNVNDYEVFSVV